MPHTAAAVFAQVIPVLFIATFLQYGRFHRSAAFVATAWIAMPATTLSEIMLLYSVATEQPLAIGADLFVWFSVVFHLIVIMAISTTEFARQEKKDRHREYGCDGQE